MPDKLDAKRESELLLEGAKVRASGRPKDARPYALGSEERIAWMEGFNGEPDDQPPDLPMDQS
ncbi:hypothetical protein [Methylobacterium gnaphalii]|uniref:Ribosome modulation factor n=1 Tax=Methylobacterium gnaphalii TaxID=1010610 RepID=A0A512JQC6_9HYPH|nr:hypothetical protein [Methylobacterium gnaphalii]GEP12165.1 hypothetical protein MGN01_40100 [Methylobacterium gnaphalii]GJD71686.1 hypothetical protein MMMDOFMJ_4649 [Methylobacterium gnaphalii]GLS48836.1 hypothetical protein GCM10007885_16830 [Methylobacterium gnaphalii]